MPGDAKFEWEDEYFVDSVKDTCVRLKDVVTKLTEAIQCERSKLCNSTANKGEPCKVITILDACRDEAK